MQSQQNGDKNTLNQQLIQAAKEGKLDKVQKLIDDGADVNLKDSDEWTPLHHVATKGHIETVKSLIDKQMSIQKMIVGAHHCTLQSKATTQTPSNHYYQTVQTHL